MEIGILLGILAFGAVTLYFMGPFPKKYRILRLGESLYEVQVQTYLGLWREAGNDYWVARFSSLEEAQQVIKGWMQEPTVVE